MEALMCAVMLALGGINPAWAEEPARPASLGEAVCPPLMTPAECGQHLETLKRLPQGRERAAYLATHQALMLDREAACRCTVSSLLPETASIRR